MANSGMPSMYRATLHTCMAASPTLHHIPVQEPALRNQLLAQITTAGRPQIASAPAHDTINLMDCCESTCPRYNQTPWAAAQAPHHSRALHCLPSNPMQRRLLQHSLLCHPSPCRVTLNEAFSQARPTNVRRIKSFSSYVAHQRSPHHILAHYPVALTTLSSTPWAAAKTPHHSSALPSKPMQSHPQ